jgi:1-deoxy-D-xylulose-5-phosphate synthase
VTFSAGMALGGLRPVAAIYSTFLQRAFDQVLHDVCIQNIPVVFALDRAGLVGNDGPTHQGVFDLSYLRCLPNMVIMAPKDENEFRHMLKTAIEYTDGPIAVRYPRDTGIGLEPPEELQCLPIGKGEVVREGKDVALIAIGVMVQNALKAADLLAAEGIEATVVNARFVKPLDGDLIRRVAEKTGAVVTIEDNARMGGFGTGVLEFLSEAGLYDVRTLVLGVPDRFIEHASRAEQLEECGLDPQSIAKRVKAWLDISSRPPLRMVP